MSKDVTHSPDSLPVPSQEQLVATAALKRALNAVKEAQAAVTGALVPVAQLEAASPPYSSSVASVAACRERLLGVEAQLAGLGQFIDEGPRQLACAPRYAEARAMQDVATGLNYAVNRKDR